MAAGFSDWKVNKQYAEHDRVAYRGKQFRCVAPHKSNSANNPKTAVTLWKKDTP